MWRRFVDREPAFGEVPSRLRTRATKADGARPQVKMGAGNICLPPCSILAALALCTCILILLSLRSRLSELVFVESLVGIGNASE